MEKGKKKILWVLRYEKCFRQKRILENDKTFFIRKKHTFLADQHRKNTQIIPDDFDLSEEFSTFFKKMLLVRSMSSQMNII